MGPAFDLPVEPFEHVCALEMLMTLARQAVEGEGFFDRFPDSEPVSKGSVPLKEE